MPTYLDAVIMPLQSSPGDLPLLIEAKSAGDFTNPNKRRKEEAVKVAQLKSSYGNEIPGKSFSFSVSLHLYGTH